jgi:hypothetical protein
VQDIHAYLHEAKLTKTDKLNTIQYYVYDYQGRRVRTVIESDQKTQSQRNYLPALDISTNQAKQQSRTLHIGTHILRVYLRCCCSTNLKYQCYQGLVGYRWHQSHWWIAEFGCHGYCWGKQTNSTLYNTMFMITKASESALSLNLTRKHKAKETTYPH